MWGCSGAGSTGEGDNAADASVHLAGTSTAAPSSVAATTTALAPTPSVGPVTAPASGDCTFDIHVELSSAVATVPIVEWTVSGLNVESAAIQFGPTTAFGLTAPVELTEPAYRTLLLGNPASSVVYFQVVANGEGKQCRSAGQTITTGVLPNDAEAPSVATSMPSQVSDGFIVTSGFGTRGEVTGTSSDGYLMILNRQGQIVWWYRPLLTQISRARLSYDGRYFYARNSNVPQGESQAIRVSLDGLEEAVIDLPEGHHDFTVTPDGAIVFIRKAEDSTCDDIVKRYPDGRMAVIFHVLDAYPSGSVVGGGELCHSNSIHYHAEDDSYTLSDLNQNNYIKVTAAGKLVWILGGDFSSFGGTGAQWDRQHGHHLFAPDRLLFFNNNGFETGQSSSMAVEVKLDEATMTAERVWYYDGGNTSATLGDVQRLTTGNTLVTYCNSGAIHEVNAQGELVQKMSWPLGRALGYAIHRESLYGPPPK